MAVFRAPGGQNGTYTFGTSPRRNDALAEPSASSLPFSHMIVGFPEQKTRFGRSRKAAEGQWMKLHCWAVYAEIRKSPKREKFSGFQVVCSPGPIRKRHFGRHAKTPDENGSNSIRLLKYHVRREKWATFGGTRGPQRAPGCQIWSQLACHCLVRLMITTPKGPVLGQNAPFGGLGGPPRDQIWSQMSPGPNSRGSIGTSDNFYVLMTTGPEAVLLYCMVLHVIELYSIVLYGVAFYFIVLHGTA